MSRKARTVRVPAGDGHHVELTRRHHEHAPDRRELHLSVPPGGVLFTDPARLRALAEALAAEVHRLGGPALAVVERDTDKEATR